MACGGCGKRSAYTKVAAPSERPALVPRSAGVVPRSPVPRSIAGEGAHGVQSGATVAQTESEQVCPTCGGKLWSQKKFIDRLRRYYDVMWCPACKKGPK